MRCSRTLCLMAFVFSGLALTSGEQKKPSGTLPIQPTAPVQQQGKPQPQVRPEPQMSAERNKVPVRQLYDEMFSNGRYDLQDQVFARDTRVHFGDTRHITLEEAVAEGKGWRAAAPDLRMTVNNITVNGDMVTVDWTATGTHTGQGHGLRPSGKHVSLRGTSRFRVVNGRIVEAWNEEYRPELFRQLGVSKTQADMFFATEKILAILDPIIPNRLYAALLQ